MCQKILGRNFRSLGKGNIRDMAGDKVLAAW